MDLIDEWTPSNPEVSKSTRRRPGFNALKIIHRFSQTMAKSMYKAHVDSEPEELEYPTDAEELSKWVKNRDERTKHDSQYGFFFDLPQRETSFDDSMHLAIFLAENGHYTQSMALLRLALNTRLATTMKSIIVSIPSRFDESEILKDMFKKIKSVNPSESREGVWSRRELTLQDHDIWMRKAFRELEDSGLIADNAKWQKKRLKLHKLQHHCHAHDNVVDRYRIEPIEPKRRFSDELWDEFESIALAILDLTLCITRSLHKKSLDLRIKDYISKEATQLEFFDVSQYVPVFSSDLPPGGLTRCIDCKISTLSTGNQKKRDFVCGKCKKKQGIA